jgi:hypothetical protein
MNAKMSPKSILSAIVLMLMMVCSNAVMAQNVVSNFASIENNDSCWKHLKDHRADTLRLVESFVCEEEGYLHHDKVAIAIGDSMVVMTSVYMDGNTPIRQRDTLVIHKTVITDKVLAPAVAASIDTACVETRFATDIKTNPRLRYDFVYGQLDEFACQFLRTDGKFVKKYGRKDGLNVAGLGSFQTGNDIRAFSGKAGVMYFGGSTTSSFKYLIPVLAGATVTKYSDLAENFSGEKYWSFTSETGFYWQPSFLTFDRLDQLRLFIGGGVKFSWYQTDVQSHVQDGITHKVSSWGSSIAPMAGLYLTYRPKATPWNFILGVQGYQSPEVRLNQDSRRPWVLNVELGVSYNLGEGFGSF